MASTRLEVFLNHLQNPAQLNFKRTSVNQYTYTLNNSFLTDEQRNFYEQNGFLIIPKLIEDDILDECRERFLDICDGKIPKGQMVVMKEKSLMKTKVTGEFLYYKIQDILWDDVMDKYFRHKGMLKYVECFTGPNITALTSMLVNKPPNVGKFTSVHPLHQDLHFFPFRPAELIVATWTAMEKITTDNGCLFVIPGTHKGVLQPHGYPKYEVNKTFHTIEGFDEVPKTYLEMEKGDTVFFHPLLMHGSGPNMTKGCRKAISCHYASSSCYFIDVKGTTQEQIMNEIKQLTKNRNWNISLEIALKMKQRVIQGRPTPFNDFS